MITRVRLGPEAMVFWVADDGALRVTRGFGGEVVGGALDLDRELTGRERFAVPRPMPADRWGSAEYDEGIDLGEAPRVDGHESSQRAHAAGKIKAALASSQKRAYAKRKAAREMMKLLEAAR